MTFGKRQLLIGALVVALGAAVYLNWQFSASNPAAVSETAAEDTKELGQTVYVNTEVSGQPKKTEDTAQVQDKKDVKNSSAAGNAISSAFAEERQKRQAARDEALAALQDMVQSAEGTDSARQEAVKAAERLTNAIKAESDMEIEIMTKGFEDCFVSVNNGSCTVIVPQEGLNEASAVTIKDIVNRQAGIDFDKITITGKKTKQT